MTQNEIHAMMRLLTNNGAKKRGITDHSISLQATLNIALQHITGPRVCSKGMTKWFLQLNGQNLLMVLQKYPTQFNERTWNIDLKPHQSQHYLPHAAPWHLAQVPQRWNWQVLQLYLATLFRERVTINGTHNQRSECWLNLFCLYIHKDQRNAEMQRYRYTVGDPGA